MAVTLKLQSYLILDLPYSKRNYCNDIYIFICNSIELNDACVQSNEMKQRKLRCYTVCGTA